MKTNEKTLEVNICSEIVYFFWKQSHNRIIFFGPTLQQEARRGYDIRALGSCIKPFYIQFKSGKLNSSGNVAIYGINNDTHNRQHHLLTALSNRAPTFYGLPIIFDINDLKQKKWQLLRNTEWLNVGLMQPLPPPKFGAHGIHMCIPSRQYTVHSNGEDGPFEAVSWLDAQKSIMNNDFISTELVFEENEKAINEVFEDELVPEDISDGLVFGALIKQ